MFDKFKASHGGVGPFAAFYDAATQGHGLFGRRGLSHERELTDSLIDQARGTPLESLAEFGKMPMTREQHGEFRAKLLQTANTMQSLSAGYDEFNQSLAKLRASAPTNADREQLDLMDSAGKYAARLIQSGNPALMSEGVAHLTQLFQTQQAYSAENEKTAAQLAIADDARRNEIRKEIQGELNAKIVDPIREDTANYEAISAQLTGNGDANAPPALVTEVLDYAGAQLRQSDDGSWSFRIGPVGFGDKAVPDMTYSQLRNQLEKAHQGRDRFMRASADQLNAQAQKRGFTINGAGVDDILFPLAGAVYKQQEAESAPTVLLPTPANVQQQTSSGAHKLFEITGAVGRGLKDAFLPDEQPPIEILRGGPGPVSGVIRRPTND